MDLATAYVQIIPTTKGIGKALSSELGDEAESAGKSAGGRLANGLKTFGKAGVAAIGAASGATVAFGKSAVEAGMNFDSSMSQVAATMGVSVDQIGELRDFAQQMGSTTSFSATEAADALNYMALAGYDANTSMEMLPNVLNLAAAGGIDLASASDMVTDAASALGLSTEDTSAMVDQMAAAASKSNTSVAQLGDAMLTIGATARNVKGGTQELSTVLGALADNGIKGSEGGTHLRNILLSLQNAAEDGAVDFGDFSVSIYDSEGNMRSMIDIIADMQNGMGDMSQEAKDAMISGVFNKTDLASVNALLNTTQDRFSELSGAIGDSAGAAQKMADTQLDNLSGDVTLFKSALEGVQIAVSDGLTPTLRDFVQAGTDGLSELAEAFRSGDMEAAMDALSGVIENIAGKMLEHIPDLLKVGVKIIEGLANAIVKSLPTLVSSIPQIFSSLIEAIISVIGTIGENMDEILPAIVDMVLGIAEALIDNVDLLIDAALKLAIGIAKGLVKAIPEIVSRIPEIIAKIVVALVGELPQVISGALELFLGIGEGLTEAIGGVLVIIPELIANLLGAFAELAPGLASFFQEAFDMIVMIFSGIVEWFQGIFDGICEVFAPIGEFFGMMFQGAWDLIVGIWSAVISFFQSIWDGIVAVFSVTAEWFSSMFQAAWDGIQSIWNAVVGWFSGVWNGIVGVFSGVASWFSGVFSAAYSAITGIFSQLAGFFSGVWNAVVSIFRDAGVAVGDAISGAVRGAVNAILGGATSIINGFISAINFAIAVINAIPGVSISPIGYLSAPQLAKGGILAKGQVGILEGTGAEAVVPLDKNKAWIHALTLDFMDELANQRALYMSKSMAGSKPASGNLSEAGSTESTYTGDIIIPVSIGGRQIERIVIDAQRINALRTGGR